MDGQHKLSHTYKGTIRSVYSNLIGILRDDGIFGYFNMRKPALWYVEADSRVKDTFIRKIEE
jgi:hypothetical protein